MSVALLMTMREADGLYHRAIVQSGGDFTIGSIEQSRSMACRILDAAGARAPSDLAEMSDSDLLAAQNACL